MFWLRESFARTYWGDDQEGLLRVRGRRRRRLRLRVRRRLRLRLRLRVEPARTESGDVGEKVFVRKRERTESGSMSCVRSHVEYHEQSRSNVE